MIQVLLRKMLPDFWISSETYIIASIRMSKFHGRRVYGTNSKPRVEKCVRPQIREDSIYMDTIDVHRGCKF